MVNRVPHGSIGHAPSPLAVGPVDRLDLVFAKHCTKVVAEVNNAPEDAVRTALDFHRDDVERLEHAAEVLHGQPLPG